MFIVSDAHWASMNLAIVLCLKCAGEYSLLDKKGQLLEPKAEKKRKKHGIRLGEIIAKYLKSCLS